MPAQATQGDNAADQEAAAQAAGNVSGTRRSTGSVPAGQVRASRAAGKVSFAEPADKPSESDDEPEIVVPNLQEDPAQEVQRLNK